MQLVEPEVNTSQEFKDWTRGLLLDKNISDLRITFTKKDGTEREMRCTLNEFRIPEDKIPKGTGTHTSDEAQRVFDLDAGQWRSFRWDSVKAVNFNLGE